jgi:methionine-rich copper-binding protein CopC
MSAFRARFIAGLAMLAVAQLALSHTSAVSTKPKSGEVLDRSPPSIEITFKDPVRITSVVVHQAGQAERKLDSTPKTSAATFKFDNPQLVPGRSEIRWIALSQDGHVIKGVIELTVKPVAATAQ